MVNRLIIATMLLAPATGHAQVMGSGGARPAAASEATARPAVLLPIRRSDAPPPPTAKPRRQQVAPRLSTSKAASRPAKPGLQAERKAR